MRQAILVCIGLAGVAACNGLLQSGSSSDGTGSSSSSGSGTTEPSPSEPTTPTPTTPTTPVGDGGGPWAAPPVSAAQLYMAGTPAALAAGNYATSFDVTRTNDVYVLVKVDPSFQARKLSLALLGPNGTRMTGYTSTIGADGSALFDVRIDGTFVGKNAVTGAFQLVLGDVRTKVTVLSQTVMLTYGGAQ
jgi:hypothetical protein